MGTTSAIPALKRELLSLLKAGLPGVQVTYSHPGDAAREEGVFFGDARATQNLPVSRAGRQKRAETVTLEILCVAIRPGEYAEGAEQAAFDLLAEVEDVLANDATIGGIAVVAANLANIESMVFLDGTSGQHGCQLTVEIEAETHLS